MTEDIKCLTRICPVNKSCDRYVPIPSDKEQEYAIFLFLVKNKIVYCAHFKGRKNEERIEQRNE